MEWQEIMAMCDPRKALIEIAIKVDTEDLSIQEMSDRVEEYAALHEVDIDEMCIYPDGRCVLDDYYEPLGWGYWSSPHGL